MSVLTLVQKKIPGIVVVMALSGVCLGLGKIAFLKQLGLGSVTLAIVLGIIVGNTIYPAVQQSCTAGVAFSKTYFLKWGIALYGFRLTFSQIGEVGVVGVISDALVLTSTFFLTYFLARKLFKLDRETSILIGAGNGICGAAAILATEPVIKASADKVVVAVAVVVIFGTATIFLYPAMYRFLLWPLTDSQWGLYIGSSIHEVAQVYAAGEAINADVANTAVITKMIRVMMLAPFLLVLSYWFNRTSSSNDHHEHASGNSITIPWFAVAFVAVAGFNSLDWLPSSWTDALNVLDNAILTMAMMALGLTTHFSYIKKAGIKPMLLGAITMVWLVVASGFLQVALASMMK